MNASWGAQYSQQRIAELCQDARGGQRVRTAELDRATSSRVADAIDVDRVHELSRLGRVASFMKTGFGWARHCLEGATGMAPHRRQLRSVEHS